MPAKSSADSPAATKKPSSSARKTKPASAAPGKKSSPAKSVGKTDDSLYTDPALRHRLKDKIQADDKGGKAGQWSARKSQLLVTEYEKAGGGYNKAGRSPQQKNLEKWTDEKWQTADGSKAARGKETARYLPGKAWDKLTPAQRKATDEKKKAGSRTGRQFVANTALAKRARKAAAEK